ncbi:hypothetical protein [Chitinivorax sp. B]|uniref:hypothetical protein n=1 Tax=Chitinivorax sp. B TaxID=2502235 RepID=UPI0010F76CFE|nr:hypothetical protein [Chitinivorax sp. B]
MSVHYKPSLKAAAVWVMCVMAAQAMAGNSTKINEQIDASGKVTVAVFERQAGSTQQHFNDFAVDVPEDFVVVGGGVEGARLPNGNLLTASYPNSNLSAWLVSTKDHITPSPTKLTAWAIGLKIQGLTRQQLMNYLAVNVSSSGYEQHPDTAAGIPQGYVLLGGGFRVNWSGMGNLATASYPETAYTWRARSKDHVAASPASTQSFAIAIKQSIPNIGTINTTINSAESSYTQHPSSTANVPAGYALTGCGAQVNWHGAGNLLWKIQPVTQGNQHGCTVSSKDHQIVSPATIRAYAIGIQVN